MNTTPLFITTLLAAHPFAHGTAFRGYGLRDRDLYPAIDPFLSVDHFWMSEPTFAPHPHAGFSAATYLFDDSETSFINSDSLGHRLEIAPGALHWTQAGAGVMHEEVPRVAGRVAHGLQIIVNLAQAQKLSPPAIQHVQAADMPVMAIGPAQARLVFGRFAGAASAWQPGSVATLVDVQLPAGSRVALPVPAHSNAVVLVITGAVQAGAGDHLLSPLQGGAVAATAEGGVLQLATGDAAARVALFLGEPLGEPLVWGGPFAMGSSADITEAKRRFAAGAMGQLAPYQPGHPGDPFHA